MSVERIIGAAAVVLVIAGVVLGFAMIGPPAEMRQRSFDETRVRNLSMLAAQIRGVYGSANSALPQRIGADVGGSGVSDWKHDPQTGRPYEYKRVDARHYRLCAVFNRASDADGPYAEPYWSHGAGRTCFSLAADAGEPVQTSVTTTVTR